MKGLVVITGLPRCFEDEERLLDHMSTAGQVQTLNLKWSEGDSLLFPTGTAVCEYAEPEDADRACVLLDGARFGDFNVLYVSPATNAAESERKRQKRDEEDRDVAALRADLKIPALEDELRDTKKAIGTLERKIATRECRLENACKERSQ